MLFERIKNLICKSAKYGSYDQLADKYEELEQELHELDEAYDVQLDSYDELIEEVVILERSNENLRLGVMLAALELVALLEEGVE